MSRTGTILRNLTEAYNSHLKKGAKVFEYTGFTYGCMGPGEVAISEELDKPPFIGVPINAIQWEGEAPPEYTIEPMRLEDWTCMGGMVWGAVYGHSHFPNGFRIHTSAIKKIDAREGGKVETRNSIYLLGKVSERGVGDLTGICQLDTKVA